MSAILVELEQHLVFVLGVHIGKHVSRVVIEHGLPRRLDRSYDSFLLIFIHFQHLLVHTEHLVALGFEVGHSLLFQLED